MISLRRVVLIAFFLALFVVDLVFAASVFLRGWFVLVLFVVNVVAVLAILRDR